MTGTDAANNLLLEAAINADSHGIRDALAKGANVNAENDYGRAAFLCALTGQSWQALDAQDASFMTRHRLKALKTLLEHDDISLYALNAPSSALHGVTPLGIAAYLNIPRAVELFLVSGDGRVLVDGADAFGATPLMYAARDANLHVMDHLLLHGAKPDARDNNHRTAVQFALESPEALRRCENALRTRRAGLRTKPSRGSLRSKSSKVSLKRRGRSATDASEPDVPVVNSAVPFPAETATTDDLIRAIIAGNLPGIRALLPVASESVAPNKQCILVNQPDARGWSPIHHAVSVPRPSVSVLDALYIAGVDVSLFTSEEDYTALHCLALTATPAAPKEDSQLFSPLYAFVMHLVRDLRCPLDARDKEDETAIHIAAERGRSVDVLLALLDCDVNRTVRELKNSRGLTALDVARPQFRVAFGVDYPRPQSITQGRPPLRTVPSCGSLASMLSPPTTPGPQAISGETSAAQELLDALRRCTLEINSNGIPNSDDLLASTSEQGKELFSQFRSRASRVSRTLDRAKSRLAKLRTTVTDAIVEADSLLSEARNRTRARSSSVGARRRTTDSGDSADTVISREAVAPVTVSPNGTRRPSAATSVVSLHAGRSTRAAKLSVTLPTWIDNLIPTSATTPFNTRASDGVASAAPQNASPYLLQPEGAASLRRRTKSHSDLHRNPPLPDGTNATASKLKSWFRTKLKTIEASMAPPQEEAEPLAEADMPPSRAEDAIKKARKLVVAAVTELDSIERAISKVDRSAIPSVYDSISQGEELLQRILENLKKSLNVPSITLSMAPTNANPSAHLTTLKHLDLEKSSSSPSRASVASTLTDDDDNDTKNLRRLILHRIDSRIEDARDAVDDLDARFRVVRDIIKSANRMMESA